MKSYHLILIVGLLTQTPVYAQDLEQIKFDVSPASDWTNLFYRSSGWFGGDGIYSIPLNGQESSGKHRHLTARW
ncbi:MAG: hypothetical protein EOO85_33435 [Pedobacter sp.]|nr:MAG: hypothetical protein EOO85_33435 [Pedobacter sp.]